MGKNINTKSMNINKFETLELARMDDNQLFMFALAAAKSLYHFDKEMLLKLWHMEQMVMKDYQNNFVDIELGIKEILPQERANGSIHEMDSSSSSSSSIAALLLQNSTNPVSITKEEMLQIVRNYLQQNRNKSLSTSFAQLKYEYDHILLKENSILNENSHIEKKVNLSDFVIVIKPENFI